MNLLAIEFNGPADKFPIRHPRFSNISIADPKHAKQEMARRSKNLNHFPGQSSGTCELQV
jgi:hypothetical protein